MPASGTLPKAEAAQPCGTVVASEAVVPSQLGCDRPEVSELLGTMRA